MLIDHLNPTTHPLPTPHPVSPPPPPSSLLTDIFSDSPPRSPPLQTNPPFTDPHEHPHTHSNEHPSDIPRLRASHVTSGYRTGIATSKAAALQGGFDEGYSLGAVMGLKVGWVLGVLEGIVSALRGRKQDRVQGGKEGDMAKEDREGSDGLKEMEGLLKQAREELDLTKVFGREWWGEDGIWVYEILPPEGGGEVTFEQVSTQHPLIKTWTERIAGLMESWDIRTDVWTGEEWEKGRIREDEDPADPTHNEPIPTGHKGDKSQLNTAALPAKSSTKAFDF